ncbi:MAG: hypothetical protein WBL25_16650 [Anaerolineales bacterium]
MKQIDLAYKNTPDTEWQLLGELDLLVSSDVDLAFQPWLMELLSPLDLSTDFSNRVLESVQDSVARALHLNAASTNGHIHLSIFAPHERVPERKTWGFFHIERIENQGEAVDDRDHAIDFYLYVEGH